MIRSLLSLLFPAHCELCGVSLSQGESELFCEACRELLSPSSDEYCRRCGAIGPQVATGLEDDGCGVCHERKLAVSSVTPLGVYDGPLRELILKMKRTSGERLASLVTRLLVERRGETLAAFGSDIVIPVPMYWGRKLTRGTSSPSLIARGLASELGVAYYSDPAIRWRSTPLQSGLSPTRRKRNVRDAFRLSSGYDFRGAKVLLVDDVLTTGATSGEITKLLKRAGARQVDLAVVARAVGFYSDSIK